MTVETQGTQPVVPAERPRGLYTARVDAKGRLKLPSAYQKYLDALQQKSFFVTTLDETTVYIFTLDEWKKKEELLENPSTGDEVELFEMLRFTANDYGADAVIDGEGRMLMPQRLREEFKIQDAPVWLQCDRDSIKVLNEEQYRAMQRKVNKPTLATAVSAMKLKENQAKATS